MRHLSKNKLFKENFQIQGDNRPRRILFFAYSYILYLSQRKLPRSDISLDNNLLGPMSPLTAVSLDKCFITHQSQWHDNAILSELHEIIFRNLCCYELAILLLPKANTFVYINNLTKTSHLNLHESFKNNSLKKLRTRFTVQFQNE